MFYCILTEHIIRWIKTHPGWHRTDQQGHRIICPQERVVGYLVAELHDRPNHITKCPICKARLGHVEAIPDNQNDKGEYRWPTVV